MKTIAKFLRRLADILDPPPQTKIAFVATLDATPFLEGLRQMEKGLSDVSKESEP